MTYVIKTIIRLAIRCAVYNSICALTGFIMLFSLIAEPSSGLRWQFLEIIIAFLIGAVLSSGVCFLAKKCYRYRIIFVVITKVSL